MIYLYSSKLLNIPHAKLGDVNMPLIIKPTAKLKYDADIYTPQGLKTLTDKQVRKEYSRLRSIAQKRLKRMGKSEWADSRTYEKNVNKYVPLKDLSTPSLVRHRLSELSRFITNKKSSITGQNDIRERTVKTLNERGYHFITEENFKQFTDFMDWARGATLGLMFDSKRILEKYDELTDEYTDEDDIRDAFNEWTRQRDSNKKPKIQNRNKKSRGMYRQALE